MKKTTTTKQNKYSLNKPVYLGVQILEINKILMYKFWYDYAKAKYGEKNVMLHGYRQLYRIDKNRRHLLRHSQMLKQDCIEC